jgi:hypothetical protein
VNLDLPRIEPAQPVRSAANETDQAGAKFKQAADTVAGVLAEDDKARIAVETQEAVLQHTKALAQKHDFIRDNPWLRPDQVEQMFGGKVPDGFDLTEQVPGQPNPAVRQRKKVIAAHEVANQWFEQQAPIVMADAARNVTDEPWRRRFERAAAADEQKTRESVNDWVRAQRAADNEIRSVSQYEQLMNDGRYDTAKALLGGAADLTMSLKTREKLRAEHEERVTKSVVMGRIRSAQTPEELDALSADITGNTVREGTEGKLSAEERYQLLGVTRAQREHIISRQTAAMKALREATFQKYGTDLFAAMQEGRPWTIANISAEDQKQMDFSDKMTLKHASEAKQDRVTEDAAIAELSIIAKVPGRLGRMTPQQMWSFVPRLSREDSKEWWNKWVQDRVEPGSVKAPVPEYVQTQIDKWVGDNLELDPKKGSKEATEYHSAVGRLVKEMSGQIRVDPSKVWTYNDIAPIALRVFHDHKKVKNADQAVIVSAIEAARASPSPIWSSTAPTDGAIMAFRRQIKDNTPLIEKAYRRYHGDEEDPPPDFGATVVGYLINGTELREVDRQLRENTRNGKPAPIPATPENRIMRIVQNMAGVNNADYAVRAADREEKARAREEANIKTEKEKAEEQARWVKMPDWERTAEQMAAEEIKAAEERTRKDAFDSARQRAAEAHNSPASFVWPEAHDMARDEVDRILPGRKEDLKHEFETAKAAYRKFMEAKDAGDPIAVDLYNRHSLWSFRAYMTLRRRNEVP